MIRVFSLSRRRRQDSDRSDAAPLTAATRLDSSSLDSSPPNAPVREDQAPPRAAVGTGSQDPDVRPPASLWTDGFGRTAVRSAQVLLVLTVIVAVVYALIQLRIAVLPVLIALILAAAIGPLVNWMRRRNVPSALATWIALLAVLTVVGGIITVVVFSVRREWGTLVEQASEGLAELQTWFTRSSPIPIDDDQIEEARDAAVDFFTSSQFASGALSGAVAVGEVIAGLLLTIVVLFFFLKDGPKIWTFLVERLGGSHKPRMRRAGARALEVLGGYVRGTAIIAAADTVLIGATLFILQVPLALPLSLIVFVGAFIPLVGATLSGVLAALVALVANGPVAALIVIIVVILVNQLEGDLLAPIVLGKSLNLHALVILLALTAGTILGGITGAILSVPIAAVTWAIIKAWKGEEAPQGTMGKSA